MNNSVRFRLLRAKSVVVMTGAGISAGSGVPTFQSGEAKWRCYKLKHLIDHRAFQIEPETVWEWYNSRRKRLKNIALNSAHEALVELESIVPDFTLITQNIDGLHTKAGSENVIEIHGNIWQVKCTECNNVSENHDVPISILPKCPKCEGLLRPNVVWIGEPLPPEKLEAAKQVVSQCDFMLIVGISGCIQFGVSLAMLADKNDAFIAEVNTEETIFSDIADLALWGKATDILPSIISLTYKFGNSEIV